MYDIMITIIKNLTVLHAWKDTTTCQHFNNNEMCCQPITKVASNRWSNDWGPCRENFSHQLLLNRMTITIVPLVIQ